MKTNNSIGIIGVAFLMFTLFTNSGFAQSQISVSFSVNMNVQISKGTFIPGSQFVDVAGFDNTWDERPDKILNPNVLTDPDKDGIYTKTITGITVAPTQIAIKFKYRINGVWSGSDFSAGYGDPDGNRLLKISTATSYSTPIAYYLDEQGTIVYFDITFNCNMTNQIQAGKFKPATQFLDVVGFDGKWDELPIKASNPNVMTSTDNLMYSITKTHFPVVMAGATYKVKYKYRINGLWAGADSSTLFGDPQKNRILTVSATPTTYKTNDLYADYGTVVTGIEDNKVNSEIQVQNPIQQEISVWGVSEFKYSILNAVGQSMKEGSAYNGSIDASELPAGLYLLRIVTEGKASHTFRIIKAL